MMFRLHILFLFVLPLLVYGQGNSAQISDTAVNFPFYSDKFSQKDSVSVVRKKEVKKFHRMIFTLSVDTIIDSSATYKLLYVSAKGWSQGLKHSNPKVKYYSKYNLAFYNKLLPISDIFRFSVLPKDSIIKLSPFDSLFLDENSVEGSNASIASYTQLVTSCNVIQSSQDYYFKNLKKRKINNLASTFVISFGGKYLFVATPITYIGNWSSWRTVEYHYYQKVE